MTPSPKEISENKAIEIRRKLNPDKAFCQDGIKHGELKGKSYLEVVKFFEKRFSGWYFNAAESIHEKTKDYNFSIVIFCCIIIDSLSQYMFGEPCATRTTFKNFCRKHLEKYNHTLKPPIVTCRYKEPKWIKEEITDMADALYHCFRCGLLHSGRVLEYGRINETYPDEIIKIVEWGAGNKEIHIHTTGLLKELKKIFKEYIEDLQSGEKELKRNFIKKMKIEYGLKLK